MPKPSAMPTLFNLLLPALLTAMMCLTQQTTQAQSKDLYGTYGVHQWAGVSLTLYPDSTFRYINHVDPSNRIDVSGTWTSDNRHVYLTGTTSEASFPARWKIDPDCSCLRSNMTKFAVIRLCNYASAS